MWHCVTLCSASTAQVENLYAQTKKRENNDAFQRLKSLKAPVPLRAYLKRAGQKIARDKQARLCYNVPVASPDEKRTARQGIVALPIRTFSAN